MGETLKKKRREEILDACETLYNTMSYQEITLKEISQVTSFSRPSIYNYFKTKEEIFLGLLTREYDLWNNDIEEIVNNNDSLSINNFSSYIALSLEKRLNLLKISSMNLYEIEENSSLEKLEQYKIVFKKSLDTLNSGIDKFVINNKEEKKKLIQLAFFPFMYGIYPYTNPTDKQIEAMKNTGVTIRKSSIYDMTYDFLRQILK